MKYETPQLEIQLWKEKDIIRTSGEWDADVELDDLFQEGESDDEKECEKNNFSNVNLDAGITGASVICIYSQGI